MNRILRAAPCATLLVTLSLLPVTLVAQSRNDLIGDLAKDLTEVEQKVLDLAKAMPDDAYAWRPMPGVRSTGEVFQHIAADNYFMPALMDFPAPKPTGITSDYQTAAAWEKRAMDRAAVLEELRTSFAFLRASMKSATDAQLARTYGQRKTSGRALWIATATHLHEHLGQLIAYARANRVTPPWSK